MYDVRELIHALARVVRVAVDVLGAKMAPLKAVDRAQVTLRALRQPDLVQVGAGPVAFPDLHAHRRERGIAG